MDKLSIITICYNCKDQLLDTIQSVVRQDYPQIEYIIIDGESSDGTQDAISPYRDKISTFISEKDHGIYDALNKGVKAATGEWILCLNAGDKLTSDTIISQVLSPAPSDTVSVLYSDCLVVHDNGSISKAVMDRAEGKVHHQNAIYRRSLHTTYGDYLDRKPYIISDLIFLLAIPESQYLKLETPIAYSQEGGVSCGLWSGEQAIGLKIAYGMVRFPQAMKEFFRLYYQTKKGQLIKRIKHVYERK